MSGKTTAKELAMITDMNCTTRTNVGILVTEQNINVVSPDNVEIISKISYIIKLVISLMKGGKQRVERGRSILISSSSITRGQSYHLTLVIQVVEL